MKKAAHAPLYDLFRVELIAMRQRTGLTQRALADRLGREHSFVSRMELGDRRIDLVELFWICKACKEDPHALAENLIDRFSRVERPRRIKKK